MKNIFKISVVLFIGLSLVFSSCKKEEVLIDGCTDSTASNYDASANVNVGCIYPQPGCTDSTAFNYNPYANVDDSTCVEFIYGCMDISAMNYSSTATSDDGNCVFAYDIAQGLWNISSECDDLVISIPLIGDFPVPLNDMFPESIEITGESLGVVSMDISGENVLADVSYDGTVIIQDGQKISLDTGGGFGVVDVDITGSGKIETATNGDLTLNLAFEVPLAGTQSSSCEITFSK